MKNYYKAALENLLSAGVPKWYIRLYLIDELIYFSRVYVYYSPYDIETSNGWYATNGVSISSDTAADRNRKCYGVLESFGFPTWEEYKTLFDGNEYDTSNDFCNAYDQHREEWLRERARESRVNYAI